MANTHPSAGSDTPGKHILVTGAAGFIGSQLVDCLLAAGNTVLGLDNLCRGRMENLAPALATAKFRFESVNLENRAAFSAAVSRHAGPISQVWHMAANSDIAAGIDDPNVDFRDTFLTTQNTLGVMKEFGIRELLFASTSAVYGDLDQVLTETTGPLLPISNYGAMKLASEAAISAAAEIFLDRVWLFRFPNVVGPRATHGIIYDLIGKVRRGASEIEVLGDGSQRKPYVHVSDLIAAMLFVYEQAKDKRNLFNIGPGDEGTYVRDIAQAVSDALSGLPVRFTGGDRGWKGDVPVVRFDLAKMKGLGWRARRTAAEAVRDSITAMRAELCP